MTDTERDPIREDLAVVKDNVVSIKGSIEKIEKKIEPFLTQVTRHNEHITDLGIRIGDLEEVQKTWSSRAWGLVAAVFSAVVIAIISFLTGNRR
jgi:predicted  nucleic acid-binding Zn-ribbon protein